MILIGGRFGSAAKCPVETVQQNPFGLPRFQVTSLVGERAGIAGKFERFESQHSRGGVMSMRAARLRRKPRDNHVGSESADDADNIRDSLLAVPDAQGLAIILGKAEVDGASEKLPASIETAGGQQFLSANHAQLFAELRAQHILSTIPAGQGQISRAITAAARQIGDELRVLVIRMGSDVKRRCPSRGKLRSSCRIAGPGNGSRHARGGHESHQQEPTAIKQTGARSTRARTLSLLVVGA